MQRLHVVTPSAQKKIKNTKTQFHVSNKMNAHKIYRALHMTCRYLSQPQIKNVLPCFNWKLHFSGPPIFMGSYVPTLHTKTLYPLLHIKKKNVLLWTNGSLGNQKIYGILLTLLQKSHLETFI